MPTDNSNTVRSVNQFMKKHNLKIVNDYQKSLLKKLNKVVSTWNNIIIEKTDGSDKKIRERMNKLNRQRLSLDSKLKESLKKSGKEQKKESNRISNTAKQSAQRAKNVEQKKKSATKTKLKNLSLRGRGGGGSMKMPQEYTKRSLLKKPLS